MRLFPAYAGVIPAHEAGEQEDMTFPRVRGGDPTRPMPAVTTEAFSPRTRG